MTKYTIGQELVVAPNGYGDPLFLTVTKVGTKYVTAKAKNGTRRMIIKAAGMTLEDERVWPSREVFKEVCGRAGRIKRIMAMISTFRWDECSLAKLDAIEAAFLESEGQAQLKATMRRLEMIP